MKKALIGIAGILVMAVVIVLFINAREGDKVVKKATTEMKSDCGNCPVATACEQKAVTEVKKCDPSICPEHTAAAVKEMKDCDPAA
jgi:positive regulator of sigma E activity